MSDRPLVIHLCGWPGPGERVIGLALAGRLSARLIDNHLLVNPASALFARDDPRHARLRAELRQSVYEAALTLPAHVPLILTDALSDEAEDWPLFAPTLEFARKRGARFVPIILQISQEENVRRLTDPERSGHGKLMEPDVLLGYRQNLGLLRPEGAFDLDVDRLSAEAAAEAIVEICNAAGDDA